MRHFSIISKFRKVVFSLFPDALNLLIYYFNPNKLIVKTICLLLVFIVFQLSAKSQSGYQQTRVVGLEQGLSHNLVLSVCKDKYGYVWIGTHDGLNRYDGMNIVNYEAGVKSGLPSNSAFQTIYKDSSGNLWIVCNYCQILKYDYINDHFNPFIKLPKNLIISTLLLDSRKNLWIGTSDGIYMVKETKGHKELTKVIQSKSLFSFFVNKIIEDTETGIIWVCGHTGLIKINISGQDTIKEFIVPAPKGPENNVSSILKDRFGNYWIGTYAGLIKKSENELFGNKNVVLNPATAISFRKTEKDISFPGFILALDYDGLNTLYVKTFKGIYLYDILSGKLKMILKSQTADYSSDEFTNSNLIFNYDPLAGILWSTLDNGLVLVKLRKSPIEYISYEPGNPASLNSIAANRAFVDSKNNLWVSTLGFGLNKGFRANDSAPYRFEHFLHNPNKKGSISHNWIYSICEPIPGEVWISAFEPDLEMNEKVKDAVQRIFIDQKYFQTDPYDLNFSNKKLQNCRFDQIFAGGKLWNYHFFEGVFVSDTLTHKSYPFFLEKDKTILNPISILIRNEDQIYISNRFGTVYRITFPLVAIDSSGLKPVHYEQLTGNPDSVYKGSFIGAITKYKGKETFWFYNYFNGIIRGELQVDKTGLEKINTKIKSIKKYTKKDGLADNAIYKIISDLKGRIWIATLNGLSCIDPEIETVYKFNTQDGLPHNWFYPSISIDKNGKLYFCTYNGVFIVHPDSLLNSFKKPEILISKIKVFNKPVKINQDSPFEPALTSSGSISLPYRQNSLSFELSSLNFYNPEQIIFKYKMDGIDEDWIDNGTNRNVAYGALPPGEYTLHVMSVLKNGVRNSDILSLQIAIIPPFYFTIWFWGLVITIIICIVLYIIRYREKILKKRTLWLEKTVKEKTQKILQQREEVDQMKNHFYTNISHEFRTPLTLINSSTSELVIEEKDSRKIRFFQTIQSASNRLLKLVNELLDLSKMESGSLKLNTTFFNIAGEIKLIWQTYLSDAERRKISFDFRSEPNEINGWFDKEFINKILQNLISNAFKFTPKRGKVSINVESIEKKEGMPAIKIVVSDSGIGISQEHLPRIFDRFYRVGDYGLKETEGTGIGLAIVQELVKRHDGTITVKSEPGFGTSFSLTIPSDKENLRNTEISKSEYFKEKELVLEENSAVAAPLIKPAFKKKIKVFSQESPKILVVEDNDDLRSFMVDMLNNYFNVFEATDGEQAFIKAHEIFPDLILSDIMMPGMDGIELCRKIKENLMTSLIPVILITAKADMESRIEGLQTGADDYLVKPFNTKELLLRIKNIIDERRKLREKFSGTYPLDHSHLKLNEQDDNLISKILKLIESNMIRSEFSVEDLAKELNFSIRSLERKINTLTGITPKELIKMVRIKFAAKLIMEEKCPVSEAAFSVGFTDPSYFTKSFRDIMGYTPTQIAKHKSLEKSDKY